MDDFEKELKVDFLEESIGLLENAEQAFLRLEEAQYDDELLDEIFRLAHNLKGASRAVGFGTVAEFTHEMENLILKLKNGEVDVSPSVVTVLLRCNDHITMMINELRVDMNKEFDSSAIIDDIKNVISGEEIEEEKLVTVPIEEEEEEVVVKPEEKDEEKIVAKVAAVESATSVKVGTTQPPLKVVGNSEKAQQVAEQRNKIEKEAEDIPIDPVALEALKEAGLSGAELQSLEDKLDKQNRVAKESSQEKSRISEVKEKPPSRVAPNASVAEQMKNMVSSVPKKVKEDESLRVSLSKIGKLNDIVGELVILQTVLEQEQKNERVLARGNNTGVGQASKAVIQLGKLSREIQEISMSLRMTPLKTTLHKMSRIVRDTSKALGKKVKLNLSGEETEIDKTVLECLADPLVHVVRNAVDHGVENPQERLEAGKSEVANVYIRAFHEGNNLVIEVSDDGQGINAEKVRNKAIEKGIIDESSTLTDEEVVQFIFKPSFSTKDEVTEFSGRGVGMDVVKTNIEKLSGKISAKSVKGKGSVFRIELPLTLAIIEGMIISVSNEKYIIPLNQVHESLRPTIDQVTFVTGMGEYLTIRGDVLPIFQVGDSMSRVKSEKKTHQQTSIVVKTSEFTFAVSVDQILYQQQVVVKKLGKEIPNVKGFMGSSILGDGRPAIILDLHEMFSGKLKARKASTNMDYIRKVA